MIHEALIRLPKRGVTEKVIEFWGGECGIILRPLPVRGERIDFIDANPYNAERGGIGCFRTLTQRPRSQVLLYELDSWGLDFSHQSYRFRGHRPDHIMNSYAIYHKTKGGLVESSGPDYKTGKVGHLYRAWAEDADGWRIWVPQGFNRSRSLLKLTLPEEFLRKARLPIVVDPTIGYTSIGGSTSNLGSGDAIDSTSFDGAPISSGTVDSISIYGRALNVPSTFKGLIFLADASRAILANGIAPPALMPSSVSPPDWTTVTFGTPPSISSGTAYYVGHINDTDCVINYDAGAPNDAIYTPGNSYAAPFAPVGVAPTPFKGSYYATYTASGGGGGNPWLNYRQMNQ